MNTHDRIIVKAPMVEKIEAGEFIDRSSKRRQHNRG